MPANDAPASRRGIALRAVVFGATGYTGQHTVSELRARRHDVWAHSRPDSGRLAALRPIFEASGAHIDTSPWNPEGIQSLLAEAQPHLIFCLLGTTREQAHSEQLEGDIYEAVEGRLTRVVIGAAKNCSPTARILFLSSIGTKQDTKNPYLATRARLEATLGESSLPYTIVRAPLISGIDRPQKRTTERAAAIVGNSLLKLVATFGASALERQFASMTGEELAKYLVDAAEDPGCDGRTLEPRELRERFGSTSKEP